MGRFIALVLSVGLIFMCRGQIVAATIYVGKAAGHALQHEQMSYAVITKTLLNAKPRKSPVEDK